MYENKVFVGVNNEHLVVEGNPSELKNSKIVVLGSNNKIIIEDDVKLLNVTIRIVGDNNLLYIRKNSVLRGTFLLDKGAKIEIGEATIFNFSSSVVEARDKHNIYIGSKCLFSHFRAQTSDVHSIFDISTGKRINKPEDIIIEDNVWIAYDALILKGAHIRKGSVVGARAVVAGSVPSNCIVAGNPARIIKANISWDTRSIDTMP